MPKPATTSSTKQEQPSVRKLLKFLAMALAVAALIKEWRLPEEERTWHGTVAGFVPYDLRKPTVERIKSTFWDPDGSIIVNRAFGVGWTINFGAIVAKVRPPSPAA